VKIVIDTNVLLAAFFGSGLCHELFERLLETDRITVVVCEHIIAEFRTHAIDKFNTPVRLVNQAERLLRQATHIVEPAEVDSGAFDDPDDLPVLGAALAANAAVVVTGDKQMLALQSFHGIQILSPRAFYDRLP
jgi:putative PIN family toxin of toxin-antitoxin system